MTRVRDCPVAVRGSPSKGVPKSAMSYRMRLIGVTSLLLCLGSGGSMGCGPDDSGPGPELEQREIPDALSSGHVFIALSSDGRFAAREDGTILELPNTEHALEGDPYPREILTFEDQVWVNAEGVWSYDGTVWQQEFSEPTRALALGKDGQPCALVPGSAQVRCKTARSWTFTPLPTPEPNEFLNLHDIAVIDEQTIWVLGSYLMGPREEQATLLVLEGGTWTEHRSDYAVVTQYGFLPTTPGAPPYVFASAPGPNPILDPSNDWATVLETPAPLEGDMFTIDERWWSNGLGGLYTLDEAGIERAADDICHDLARWDHDTVLCANWEGGLSFITRGADGTYTTVTR